MDPSIRDCLFSHGFLSSINTAIPVARWCRQESNLKHKLQAARWTLQGSKISCNFESVYLLIFVDFSSLFCIGCWKFRIVRFVFLDPRDRTGFIVPKLIGLRVTCRKFDQVSLVSPIFQLSTPDPGSVPRSRRTGNMAAMVQTMLIY
jgi:hypothetical protein